MPAVLRWRILVAQSDPDPERRKQLINPLAIGVTLGGLLLDVLVPRPKPRVGLAPELRPSVVPGRAEDTLVYLVEEYEHPPVASGASHRLAVGAG